MIDISKPLAATRESLALTRATLARIDGMWTARRADGTVVSDRSRSVVMAEIPHPNAPRNYFQKTAP
jgi:hypothetical protein